MKLFLVACLLCLFGVSALAQSGAVIVNVNGITCVTGVGQTGFNALSYSLGGTVKTGQPGSGREAKVPSLQDLMVSKNFDACSERLIRLFLGSTVVPVVTLIQYSPAGGSERPYAALTITLTNALMNSYEVTGAPQVHPTETLDFTYSKVCVSSITQAEDGRLLPPVTVCYDVAGNKLS